MDPAEALHYRIIKVARDEDLFEQIGKDFYFDLVDHDKVCSFRVEKKMPFKLFKEEVAKVFGVPVQFQRFWKWARRINLTYRPNRPLKPKEETQSVGKLKEVANEAHNAELKLLLEVELGLDLLPTPLPDRTKADIMLFFKLYDPEKEELRYVGRLFVKGSGKPLEILAKLNEMAGFAPGEEIELYEEIKFEPTVMCEHIDKKGTFCSSQLEDGGIICFQKPPPADNQGRWRYPNVPSFLEYVLKRQTRTVQVGCVSDLAGEREIAEFFSFFGEIEHIEIRSDVGQSKTAFVTFKDSEALEIALLLSEATIVDQIVTITAVPNYVPKAEERALRIVDGSVSDGPAENNELDFEIEKCSGKESSWSSEVSVSIPSRWSSKGGFAVQTLATDLQAVGTAEKSLTTPQTGAVSGNLITRVAEPNVDSSVTLPSRTEGVANLVTPQPEIHSVARSGQIASQQDQDFSALDYFNVGNESSHSSFKQLTDVSGFKVPTKFASLYKSVHARYGHIATTKVLRNSTSALMLKVIDILKVIEAMACRRVSDLDIITLEYWDGHIQDAEALQFNVTWLRERLNFVSEEWKKATELRNSVSTSDTALKSAIKHCDTLKAVVEDLQKHFDLVTKNLDEAKSALNNAENKVQVEQEALRVGMEQHVLLRSLIQPTLLHDLF